MVKGVSGTCGQFSVTLVQRGEGGWRIGGSAQVFNREMEMVAGTKERSGEVLKIYEESVPRTQVISESH